MRTRLILLFIIGSFLLPGCFVVREYSLAKTRANEAQTKANQWTIVIELERYKIDNYKYPETINALIVEGYFSELPDNPWTEQPMEETDFGLDVSPGTFTYIFTEIKGVGHYYIFSYGETLDNGIDIDKDGTDDKVLLVISSLSTPGTADVDFPEPSLL